MWPITVTRTEIQQNSDHAASETRAKLLEIADNIESGKYRTVSLSMVAIDDENRLVLADLNAGNIGLDDEPKTVWSQVSAQIVDETELAQAYQAFALDLRLNYESIEDTNHPNVPEVVNVSFGNEDEDDFEGFSFVPSEAVHPQLKSG